MTIRKFGVTLLLVTAHANADAKLREAEAKLLRAQTLETKDVVSEAELLEAKAARDIAAANVEQARLKVELQNLVLSRFNLVTPFSGVMSAPLVRENGWQDVGGTGRCGITMAIVTQLDPIQVIGEVPYSVFAERRKLLKTDEAIREAIVLSLVLPDGEEYQHDGRLVSGGYKFDEDT